MALVPCPACGLPRAAADADSPCPACHWAEPPRPAAAPAPPPPPPEPAHAFDPPHHGNALLAAGLGVAVGVIATLALVTYFQRPPEPEPVRAAAPPTAPEVAALPVAPPPRPVEPDDDEPLVVPVPIPVPVAADGGFAVLKVDQPDGTFAFPRLGPGNKVKLLGRVKRLTIDGLDGGAELNATGLANDGVGVAEAVDGGSVLRLKSDGGTVSFRRGVLGGSVVELDAPKAFVTFAGGTGAKAGPAVGGGSRVTVRAKAVVFGGPVTGAKTEVALTFERGGSLKLDAVTDGAVVRYRPGHRADPPVRVTPAAAVTADGPVREEPPPG